MLTGGHPPQSDWAVPVIRDGDIVTVRRQDAADSGDIVAALIHGEATVKRLRRADDGHAWLMPHTPAYNPIPRTPRSSSVR